MASLVNEEFTRRKWQWPSLRKKKVSLEFLHPFKQSSHCLFYKGSWNHVIQPPGPVDGSLWALRFRWDLFVQLPHSKCRLVQPNDNLRTIFVLTFCFSKDSVGMP